MPYTSRKPLLLRDIKESRVKFIQKNGMIRHKENCTRHTSSAVL